MSNYPDWLPCGLLYDRHLINQIRNEQALHHFQDADIKAILEASVEDAQRILQHYLQHRTGHETYHPVLLSGAAIKCLVGTLDVIEICQERNGEDVAQFARNICAASPQDFITFWESLASAPFNDASARARRIVRRANEILTFRKYTFDRLGSYSPYMTVLLKNKVKEFSDTKFSPTRQVSSARDRKFVTSVYNCAMKVGLNKPEALACVEEVLARHEYVAELSTPAKIRLSATPASSRTARTVSPAKRPAEDQDAPFSPIKKAKLTATAAVNSIASSSALRRVQASPTEDGEGESVNEQDETTEGQLRQYGDEDASDVEMSDGERLRLEKEEKRHRKEEKRARKEAKKLRKEEKRKAKEEEALRKAEKQKQKEEKRQRKEEKKRRREECEPEDESQKDQAIDSTPVRSQFPAQTPDTAKARQTSQSLWTAIDQNDSIMKSPDSIRKDSHQEDSETEDSDDGLPKIPASQLASPVDEPSRQLLVESQSIAVTAPAIQITRKASVDSVIPPTSEHELEAKYLKSFIDPNKTLRKQTGKTSEFFNKSPTLETRRMPAGTSAIPVPPLDSAKYGLVQEELASQPFTLLIATKLLNKTKGHLADRSNPQSALNTFGRLMDEYPGPVELAAADATELMNLIKHLGLQNTRAKTLIGMATAWLEKPPKRGTRYRTPGYPKHVVHAGRDIKTHEDPIRDDGKDPRVGAFEIGHIPGVGPYALDSWRIFCRDRLRGLAKGWNGEAHGGRKGPFDEDGVFEPEWKRVRPGDKELRAFLKWLWLKEGWVWDPESGERVRASEDVLERARTGSVVL